MTIEGLTAEQVERAIKVAEATQAHLAKVEAEKAAAYPSRRIQLGNAREGYLPNGKKHGTQLLCLCEKCNKERWVYTSDIQHSRFCTTCAPEAIKAEKAATKKVASQLRGLTPAELKAIRDQLAGK